MIFENEKKILNIIKYTPPIFIISIGFIIAIFLYFENISTYNNEKQKIQEEHIKINREVIKEKVHEVYNYIIKEQKETEAKLKESLKDEIDKAHTIMMSIYRNNQHKSKNEIKQIIKDALRDIRFNNDRGYFFIYDMKGTNILLPTHPHLENKNFINHQDAQGKFIIRKIVTTMKKKEEAYFNWHWYKPNNKKEQKKKIGIAKQFKPLDWFIGTGEYLEDFEQNIQNKVLDHIRKIRYGKNGYIFIITYDTTYLSHMRPSFWGKSAVANNDAKGIKKVIQDLINIAKKGEGYSSYIQNKKPGSDLPTHKLSFVKGLQNWSWMIGTGFYEDDIKETLKRKKTELNTKYQNYIQNTIIISILLTIVLLFISIYISKQLRKRFINYKKEIEEHITHNNKQQNIISQQAKMAAMGEMISNIAHQWRQPLSTITAASTGMRVQKELGILNDQYFFDGIDNINQSAQHLSHTIDDFRNFFHSSKEEIEFNINTTFNKTITLLNAQFKNKNIQIIQDIAEITLKNLENEFIQVLMNLLNNARDELIKKSPEQLRLILINVYQKDSNIIIEIKDNAGGIPPALLPRIFEPYFTTKHKAQGTGIGLYMSKEIIEKHMQGTLEAKNESFDYNKQNYHGANFIITFPKPI